MPPVKALYSFQQLSPIPPLTQTHQQSWRPIQRGHVTSGCSAAVWPGRGPCTQIILQIQVLYNFSWVSEVT